MSEHSKIEWTDTTWNPLRGCTIELFYFLANSWLERALSGQKDMDKLARWWGADDWTELKAMSRQQRQQALVERMKRDLCYKSVKAWPIYQRENGAGIVMYYMIHATDHPEGPKLMWRGYRNAVQPLEPAEQLAFELEEHTEPEKIPVQLKSRLLL